MSNDIEALLAAPQIHTDDNGVHRDAVGREYEAVDVGGETTYRATESSPGLPVALASWPPPDEGFRAGRIQGIRDASLYISRVGRLLGSNEYRLRMAGAPEFLRELADAVEAGDVTL